MQDKVTESNIEVSSVTPGDGYVSYSKERIVALVEALAATAGDEEDDD